MIKSLFHSVETSEITIVPSLHHLESRWQHLARGLYCFCIQGQTYHTMTNLHFANNNHNMVSYTSLMWMKLCSTGWMHHKILSVPLLLWGTISVFWRKWCLFWKDIIVYPRDAPPEKDVLHLIQFGCYEVLNCFSHREFY